MKFGLSTPPIQRIGYGGLVVDPAVVTLKPGHVTEKWPPSGLSYRYSRMNCLITPKILARIVIIVHQTEHGECPGHCHNMELMR